MEKKFDKKEWSRKDREKNLERYREYNRKHEQTESRKEYMKSEQKKDYYKKRYEQKKEEIRNKQKEYYENNKEKINNINKEYYENNKEKIKKQITEYRKVKKKVNPLFKLTLSIRSLIYNSFKRKGYKKNSKTYMILGCGYEEFKQHLEKQFELWMNWDNYGKYNGEFNFGWDIDHIVPQSSAETEEELRRLNHYTNLKPLCSKTNRDIKRNR